MKTQSPCVIQARRNLENENLRLSNLTSLPTLLTLWNRKKLNLIVQRSTHEAKIISLIFKSLFILNFKNRKGKDNGLD